MQGHDLNQGGSISLWGSYMYPVKTWILGVAGTSLMHILGLWVGELLGVQHTFESSGWLSVRKSVGACWGLPGYRTMASLYGIMNYFHLPGPCYTLVTCNYSNYL